MSTTPNKRVSGFVPSALRPNPSHRSGLQIPAETLYAMPCLKNNQVCDRGGIEKI